MVVVVMLVVVVVLRVVLRQYLMPFLFTEFLALSLSSIRHTLEEWHGGDGGDWVRITAISYPQGDRQHGRDAHAREWGYQHLYLRAGQGVSEWVGE